MTVVVKDRAGNVMNTRADGPASKKPMEMDLYVFREIEIAQLEGAYIEFILQWNVLSIDTTVRK